MAQEPSSVASIRVHALGGFHSIGASSVLVTLDGVNVLIDCGINAAQVDDPFPQALKTVSVDAVLISHAHIDHIGALPIVLRHHPGVRVFSTLPTKLFARIMLRDASTHIPRDKPDYYSQEEAEKAAEAIEPISFEQKIEVQGLSAKFRRAGHILGASTVILEGSRRVVYTGDFSVHSTRLTPGPVLPESPEPCDLLFSETTYGSRQPKPREEQELVEAVSVVLRKGGRVLIPSFALGRAQEVMVLLAEAMMKGTIPESPIYLDGLVKQVNEVCMGLEGWVTDPSVLSILRDHRFLKPVESYEKRLEILFDSEPCVIVASSGMLTGGWSPVYAKDFTSRADAAIFFVGYLDEDSPGRALKDLASSTAKIGGDEMKRLCDVKTFNLSAHANHDGLVTVNSLYRPKMLIPMHGDQSSRHSVGNAVNEAVGAQVFYPYSGQVLDIDPDHGRLMLKRSEDDKLSIDFLDSVLPEVELSADAVAEKMLRFMEEHGILGNYVPAEKFMWEVFRNCGDYLSLDPWRAVTERTVFLKATERIHRDRFPEREKAIERGFERSVSAFLSNLILYGVNPSWKGLLKEVNVETLEEAESLMVQIWNNFEFRRPTIAGLYQRCKLRVEWPSGNEYEAKVELLFAKVESTLELLEAFDVLDFLVVHDTIVGAFNKEIILLLTFPPSAGAGPQASGLIKAISESRLVKLANWTVADNLQPIPLPIEAGPDGPRVKLTDQLRETLAKTTEPFRGKIGGGILSIFSDIPTSLKKAGFSVRTSPRFLDAVHTRSKKRLLVVPDENGERFADYSSVPGCMMGIPEFKSAIGKISKVWTPKQEVSPSQEANGLAVDVITPYGWHAREPVAKRRIALEHALDAYTYQHLVRLLRYLRDVAFKEKPSLSAVVREDLEWFEITFGARRSEEVLAFEREVLSHCGYAFTRERFDRVIAIRV